MLGIVLALTLSAAPASAAADPPTFTLAEAVARARRESPLRASAAATADGADAAAKLAGRVPNPVIDAHVENLGASGPLSPGPDVFALVSQPVELGGKRGARRNVAGSDRDVSSLLLQTVERQIALDTTRAYMRAVRARDVLATLASQRDGMNTMVTTMRRRVEEGLAPGSDLLRFEAESARLAVEITRTDIELRRSLLDLASLLGAVAPISAAQLVSPAPLTPPRLDDASVAKAVAQRADVKLAAARVGRAESVVTLENARRLPDPVITGGYKRTTYMNTAVIGVVMSVPLFDRNAQARALASASVKSANSDLAATQLRAEAEARASMAAATALAQSLSRVGTDLLAPAEGVRNAAQAMFREGATDVLKLVDAERIYTDVRREALSLAIDAYVAAVEARFAVAEEDIP